MLLLFYAYVFIIEMVKKYTNVVLNGPRIYENLIPKFTYKCPRCGYPLQTRQKRIGPNSLKLYICSNDPEVCGFVTNDVMGGNLSITKCPCCEDGYLIVKKVRIGKNGNDIDNRKRILGCSNYKPDGSGCNYVIDPKTFSEDWSKTSRKTSNYCQGNRKIPIQTCILAGYPIMDLLRILKYITGSLTIKAGFHFNKFSLAKFAVGDKCTKSPRLLFATASMLTLALPRIDVSVPMHIKRDKSKDYTDYHYRKPL